MGAEYSRTVTNEDGLCFGLNEKEFTANIMKSPNASGKIFIPRTIIYESKEYIIKGIDQGSFSFNTSIQTIDFPYDSELLVIGKEAFSNSSIEEIKIPSRTKQIGESSFSNCSLLKKVDFSENSELLKIEKRAFSNSSIETISFPSSLEQICEFSFSNCRELRTINFPEKSELFSIDKYAFFQSSLEDFSFPANLKEIGAFSFSNCKRLKSVNFPENSELYSIDKFAFVLSSIERFSIPRNVEKLAEGWCCLTPNLAKIMISPNNKLFACQDDDQKMLFGKSKIDSDSYDVLILACHDFIHAVIPSSVKIISSYAFSGSRQLKTVEFHDDSELVAIRSYAFQDSAIEKIKIPDHVTEIGENSFSNCFKLSSVEFSKNSELDLIRKEAFSETLLEYIRIPAQVSKIEKRSFANCKKLTNIEFLSDNFIFDFSILENCDNINVLSFPNANKINVNTMSIDLVPEDLTIFVCPGIKVTTVL